MIAKESEKIAKSGNMKPWASEWEAWGIVPMNFLHSLLNLHNYHLSF